ELEEYAGQLIIVDAFTSLVGSMSNEKYVVEDPENIESLSSTVEKAMEENAGATTVVLGSLSTIMDMCGETATLDAVEQWNQYGMLYDHVMIYNLTAWPYDEQILNRIRHDLFDAVIEIRGVAERIVFGQYFGILHSDWCDTVRRSMLFKVLRPGGIRIFIPKILVTGPFNAGKSTFVHALSTRSVSVDRLGTTIALDHGHVDHDGFSADIFGTPGQSRFDPIVKMLSAESMGVFLILDSTNPADFVRAKEMLNITKAHGLPVVAVATKQDLPDALSPDEIRDRMKLPMSIPIVTAMAPKNVGVMEAFETLINMITEGE
ncbi:MAG: GTP-binding protein, partial [Methanosarcinales archaeon]|nr:GTP-binding protein [Methanosarcinales archaeon]